MKTDDLIKNLGSRIETERPSYSIKSLSSLWVIVSLILTFTPLLMIGLRLDLKAGDLVPGFWPYSLGLFVFSSCAFYLAWVTGIPARRPGSWVKALISLLLAMIGVGVIWMAFPALAQEAIGDGFALRGARCMSVELLLTSLPGVLFFLVFRKLAPTRPALTGALGFMAAGSLSSFVLTLHCPSIHPIHLLLWHIVPVGMMSWLGSVFARKLLCW